MEKRFSDVEALLTEKGFSNPDHKEKLRRRIKNLGTEVSEGELGQIAGGLDPVEIPAFEKWTKKP